VKDVIDELEPGVHTATPQGFSSTGRIAVRRKAIAGRHLWKLPRPHRQKYFGSDELRQHLREEKLDGWHMERKCVLTG
jgi:hypothetical protein